MPGCVALRGLQGEMGIQSYPTAQGMACPCRGLHPASQPQPQEPGHQCVVTAVSVDVFWAPHPRPRASQSTAGMLPTLTFYSERLEAAYLSHAAPTRARTAARFACFRFVLLVFTAARRVSGRLSIRAAAAGAVPPLAAARRPPAVAVAARLELRP